MKYAIKRNNNLIAQVEPQGNISTKIMSEELVNMTFELSTMVKFQIGDMVNVYGANYYLLQAPVVEKVNTKHFKYSLQFGSIIYELSKIQLLFPDAENKLTVSEGNPIGNADLLIGHVLNNANRLQNGWTKGTVIETEAKQVDFSEDNCLSALAKIAEAFEVEYWIDADKSIHIVERKSDSGYSFQYGKNKGLKSITRNPMDGSNIVTRLYALGSEKNIGAKYRNGSKRLKMDVPYLEKNTDIYNVIEHTKKFDEVYPKRIGTVTAVDANNPLIFTDSTMDFDLNERDGNGTTILIQGVPAKVTFQTGQLAGYMLEIKENGYHTATKTFTLNKNKDEKAIEVPSNLMRPKVGDQYIITDIVMPASYVTNAEAELKVKAQEYLDKNCKERLQYTVVSDPFYFKEINANIALGKTIHFTDADLGLDANLRILSISKDLQNPYKVAFEIGEDAAIISIVRAYIEKEKQQAAIIKEQKYNAQLARRSYAMAREEFDKYFDNSGYLDPIRIKPESIETGMLMVGTRSQQFSLPDVVITVGADNTSLKNTAGQLVHLTVDPKAPRTWQIAANTQYGLSTNFNYLYVKADKKGSNATLMATEVKLLLDSDPVFYYFLIGSVSSIIEGFRRVKVNAGYTSVAPGEITTGRISSADGSNWIDLLQDRIEINARVRFAPGSQAQNYVDGLFSTANQNTQNAVNNIQVGGRNLIVNSRINESSNTYGFGVRTSEIKEGESYVFTFNGRCNNVSPGKVLAGYLYQAGWAWGRNAIISSTTDTTAEIKFIAPYTGTVYITFYYYDSSEGREGNVTVNWCKLEKGNKATDWTPAPEDIDNKINDIDFGSVNLLNNSAVFGMNPNDVGLGTSVLIENEGEKFYRATPDNGKRVSLFEAWYKLESNQEYVRGIYVRHFAPGEQTITIMSHNATNGGRTETIVPSGKWTFIKTSTIVGSGLESALILDATLANYSLDYKKTMLVKGNRLGNDWVPSVADVKDGIDRAQNSANQANNSIANLGVLAWKNAVDKAMLDDTIIEGGYIKTTLINAQSIVVGGGGVTNNQLVESLNNIKIGGRNTYKKSTELGFINLDFDVNNPNTPNGFFIVGRNNPDGNNVRLNKVIDGNGEWTVSWEMRGSQNISIGLEVDICDLGLQYFNTMPDNSWKKYSLTVNVTNYSADVFNFVDFSRFGNVYYYIKNIKVERGNKATDWSPAPEDVENGIHNANQNAQNAQNTANSAINAANGLQGQVNGLSEDIKIKLLASSYAYGKCLYRDVNFRDGVNGISAYNNADTGAVQIVHWVNGASSIQAPSKSPNVLAVKYVGGNTSPNYGGFYFGTQTRANAVFVVRVIAKVKAGCWLTEHRNQTGDNPKWNWVTSNQGTGNWEEYIGVLRCGSTGYFSSAMFFAVAGDYQPNDEMFICYASVFDLTDVEKDIYAAVENMQVSLNDVKTKTDNFTSIQGGLVMSNIMSVGSTQMQQNAFLSGVTDNGALSIRIGAGANYANKNAAPFRVLDNGKMFASDAEITGVINANSGRIGQFNIQGSSLIASSTGQPGNSWDPWSSYAMITPEMVLFRTNGANSDSVKEAGFGITQSAGTGSDGAMGFIKHNIQNYGGTNIGLRVQAKNATENIALDILDGDIRVKGQKGYTGQWRGFWVQNGLIVSVY